MKNLLKLLGMTMVVVLLMTSCSKDEDEKVPPTLNLKAGEGWVSQDMNAAAGDTLNFGITAASNGTDNLVNFKIKYNQEVVYDSTFNNATFEEDLYTLKTPSETDVFEFIVTDKAGNVTSITVTVTGEFGEINTYNVVLLGAQDNVDVESFLSLSNNTTVKYMQGDAFNHQADIDMFCFYEDTPENQNFMTLAAPGSGIEGIFTGNSSPDNYTVKNTTRFVKAEITATQFDQITNDGALIFSYKANEDNARRKASKLTADDVYSFKIQSGLYGLLKVISVNGTETGTLEMAIKIQKTVPVKSVTFKKIAAN